MITADEKNFDLKEQMQIGEINGIKNELGNHNIASSTPNEAIASNNKGYTTIACKPIIKQ